MANLERDCLGFSTISIRGFCPGPIGQVGNIAGNRG